MQGQTRFLVLGVLLPAFTFGKVTKHETNAQSSNFRVKRFAGSLEAILTLTQDEIDKFVDDHNMHRSSATASNMLRMTWDDDIANFASFYASQCNFAHSDNRDRELATSFPSLGENLYITLTSSDDWSSLRRSLPSVVTAWHNEINYYDYDTQICQEEEQCGHYTQVVWANSFKVGCGAAICTSTHEEFLYSMLVSCNYGPPGNFLNPTTNRVEKPFQLGPPCSLCSVGDACIDNLCSNVDRDGVNFPTSSTTIFPPTSSTTISSPTSSTTISPPISSTTISPPTSSTTISSSTSSTTISPPTSSTTISSSTSSTTISPPTSSTTIFSSTSSTTISPPTSSTTISSSTSSTTISPPTSSTTISPPTSMVSSTTSTVDHPSSTTTNPESPITTGRTTTTNSPAPSTTITSSTEPSTPTSYPTTPTGNPSSTPPTQSPNDIYEKWREEYEEWRMYYRQWKEAFEAWTEGQPGTRN
ncbi:uncharacterized protein LOC143458685 [Clavelina lepadiformis]|uniref:uncharacterized protein LOC143458685 n=1 Tax=Clavelina lepadiformis TaxID=159417 RepID=UPI004042EE83